MSLAEVWHRETGGLSSPTEIAQHWAYREIIEMGEDVVPLILGDLRDRGGQWYTALREITGANPVPADARGNARRVKEAWFQLSHNGCTNHCNPPQTA